MRQSVIIDCFPESAARYRKGYAVVAIDVIRATTMAISAVAAGWRCYAVPTLEAARSLHRELDNAVLAGEVGGNMPEGFNMNNSPVELARRTDSHRPLILLSSSGTQLIREAGRCLVMLAKIASKSFVIVLLDSYGKYTRIGDAERVRHWLETGEAAPASIPRSGTAGKHSSAKPTFKGQFPPRVAKYVESLKQVKYARSGR